MNKIVFLHIDTSQIEDKFRLICKKAETDPVLKAGLLEWQTGKRGAAFVAQSLSRSVADDGSARGAFNAVLEFSQDFLDYLAAFGAGYFDSHI